MGENTSDCSISIISSSDNVSELTFGYITKLVASLGGHVKQLLQLPKYGIALILDKHWSINSQPEYHAIAHLPEKKSSVTGHDQKVFSSSREPEDQHKKSSGWRSLSEKTLSFGFRISDIVFAKPQVGVKSKAVYKSTVELKLPSTRRTTSPPMHKTCGKLTTLY